MVEHQMTEMTPALLVVIKASIAALIFAIGLGSTLQDILYLSRRPMLLLRAVVAMYVLVPAAALLLVAIWSLPQGIKAAFLVLAVSAGAPLLPRKLGNYGGGTFSVSLLVITSFASMIVVPVWIAMLARQFGVTADLSPVTVISRIVSAFLLPLAIGMAIGRIAPSLAGQFANWLAAAAGVALIAASLFLLGNHWDILLEIHWNGFASLVVLMVIAIAIGHVLGGPEPDHRTALAIACATRHIGVAVLVAAMFPGPRTIVILAMYVIASLAVSLPYLRWRRQHG